MRENFAGGGGAKVCEDILADTARNGHYQMCRTFVGSRS